MRDFQSIIKKMAKDHHTTTHEVLREMQSAIDYAYDHPTAESRLLWERMCFRGKRPTVEEFVTQLGLMLEKRNGLLQ